MLILTPPSEGKSIKNTVNIQFSETNFVFAKQVKEILILLKSLNENKIVSTYGTNLEKAKDLHKINLKVFDNKCSMAIERYTGVVFSNLDWKSLDNNEKAYLNKNLRIFSGMFGLLKPNDLIPNYKLKMNVLALTNFWKIHISNQLNKEDLILDLLPAVHRKAFNLKQNVFKINFLINKDGKLIQSAHAGKVVKGKFIRFLAQHNIQDFEELKKFSFDGYKWNGDFFLKNS